MIQRLQQESRQRGWPQLTEEAARQIVGYEPVPASVTELLRQVCVHGPCLLIFDEFDVLGESTVSEHFANLMKALSDLGVPVKIVIVGVAEDIDALLIEHASVARGLQQVKMPRLSAEELRHIVDAGARRAGLTYAANIVDRIVALSQGLPHYTHLLAKHAGRAAILGGKSVVEEELWTATVETAHNGALQQVVDLYQNATVSSQQTMLPDLLVACALAKKDQQGFFRPTEVVEPLSKLLGRQMGIPSFNKNLASLAGERGPALEQRVFVDKRPRYRFANPLLQPYIFMNAVAERRLNVDAVQDWSSWGLP